MTDEVKATVSNILERWGFPVLVALAAGWVLRHDVLLPLVEEHRTFVKNLGEIQRDISEASHRVLMQGWQREFTA